MEPPVGYHKAQNATMIVNMVNRTLPGHLKMYSPLMLCNEWSKVARLLFVVFCASFGSTINGFFVSSFFVERSLKKAGNIYLTCTGLSDMVITAGVMSVISVVLLSGQWDNLLVCKTLQVATETATYSYSWFFVMVAIENFYRVCRTSAEYEILISMRIGLISFTIFCISFVLAAVGVILDLDYDYCERLSYGNFTYRITTSVIFHGIFTILTLAVFIVALCKVRRRAREQIQYRRSELFKREYSFIAMNLTAFILFVVAWIPYCVVVNEFPSTSDARYYNTVWIGLLRSVFTSFIYGIVNRNFRRAYAHLFNYCFCKSSLSSSFGSRRGRAVEFKTTTGDVRVHIMHQAIVSPHRGASTIHETQDL